jgi:ankyrin repeat protein/tetratricopeptide (TPR) repeat protein
MLEQLLRLKELSGGGNLPNNNETQTLLSNLHSAFIKFSELFNQAQNEVLKFNDIPEVSHRALSNWFAHNSLKITKGLETIESILHQAQTGQRVNVASLGGLQTYIKSLLEKTKKLKGDLGSKRVKLNKANRTTVDSYLEQLINCINRALERITLAAITEIEDRESAAIRALRPEIDECRKKLGGKGDATYSCFVSYAHGNDEHEAIVAHIARQLESIGLEVYFDRWANIPGQKMQDFVRKIVTADWIILFGSRLYQQHYNQRVGYLSSENNTLKAEAELMSAIAMHHAERADRIIPVLLEGNRQTALPQPFFNDYYTVNLSNDNYVDQLVRLVRTLFKLTPVKSYQKEKPSLTRRADAPVATSSTAAAASSSAFVAEQGVREAFTFGCRAYQRNEAVGSGPSKKHSGFQRKDREFGERCRDRNYDRNESRRELLLTSTKNEYQIFQQFLQEETISGVFAAGDGRSQIMSMEDSVGLIDNDLSESFKISLRIRRTSHFDVDERKYNDSMDRALMRPLQKRFKQWCEDKFGSRESIESLSLAEDERRQKRAKRLDLRAALEPGGFIRYGVVSHRQTFISGEKRSQDNRRQGRESILGEIEARFETHAQTAQVALVDGCYTSTVLAGLGGVGKSMTAREYVLRQMKEENYGLFCWVDASSKVNLQRSFEMFADKYFLVEARSDDYPLDIVGSVYESLAPFKRCLFIFDGADDVKQLQGYLPTAYQSSIEEAKVVCHSLITSRSQEWEGLIPVTGYTEEEMEKWIKANSIPLRGNDVNPLSLISFEECLKLAEALGYHPLALFHAANFIARKECNVHEYLERLHSSPVGIFHDQDNQPLVSSEAHYKDNVMVSLALSVGNYIDWAARLPPEEADAAKKVLACLSLCQQTEMHRPFIEQLVSTVLNMQGDDVTKLARMVYRYLKASAITQAVLTGGNVEIHQLMQTVIKHYYPHNADSLVLYCKALCDGFSYSYEQSSVEPGRHYAWWEAEIKGVLTLAQKLKEHVPLRQMCARLQHKLGDYYLFGYGVVNEAFSAYQDALEWSLGTPLAREVIWRAKLGNGLGYCHFRRDKHIKAKQIFTEVLSRLGEKDLPLKTLEGVFAKRTLGYLKKARDTKIAIYKECLNYFYTLDALTSRKAYEVALVYTALGDESASVAQALEYYKKALGERKGIVHPDLFRLLSKIAESHMSLGNQKKAFKYYKGALEIAKKLFVSRCPVEYIKAAYQLAVVARAMYDIEPTAGSSSAVVLDNTAELAEEGFKSILVFIQKNKLLPNFMSLDSEPLLHLAVAYGHVEYIQWLAENRMLELQLCNKNGDTALLLALRKGDEEVVSSLLTAGSDVTAVSQDGDTALHCAVDSGKSTVVERILALQAVELEAKDSLGDTALLLALWKGHEEVVSSLLTAGSDVTSVGQDGYTALHCAVYSGKPTVVERILALQTVELEAKTNSGETAFLLALWKGDEEVVSSLLTAGSDVTAVGQNGLTALHGAASSVNPTVVERILALQTVELEAKNSSGDTALLLALWNGDEEVVSSLLTAGSDVTAVNQYGLTALHCAVHSGKSTLVVRILVLQTVELEAKTSIGDTALLLALGKGDEEVVSSLLTAGSDVTAVAQDGNTALHCAVHSGKSTVVERILALQTVELEAKTSSGDTALLLALWKGDEEVVSSLLTAGSDMTAVGQNGNTALHCAVHSGKSTLVARILALQTVELEAKTSIGETALLLALWKGHEEVVSSLLTAGSDVTAVGQNGETALHGAVRSGKSTVVERILALQTVELEAKTSIGDTALLQALWKGYDEAVSSLLTAGSDVTAVSQDGDTALHRAVHSGKSTVVERILALQTVELEAKTSIGDTALLLALWKGYDEVVSSLLTAGSDVTAVSQDGDTALHRAVHSGKSTVVERILALQTVELEAKTSSGDTALLLALWKGYDEVVSSLLTAGSDVTAVGQNGYTALHCAVHSGKSTVVERILALQTVELEAKNSIGETALLPALGKGHEEVVSSLLTAGSDVTAVCQNGETALHGAVRSGKSTLVERILALQTVELEAKNSFGETALLLALWQGRDATVSNLLTVGSDVTAVGHNGSTALHCAVASGNPTLVGRILALQTVELEAKNAAGITALLLALRKGHDEVASCLLTAGSDVTTAGHNGDTALHSAVDSGKSTLVERILVLQTVELEAKNRIGETALLVALGKGYEEVVSSLLTAGSDVMAVSQNGNTALHCAVRSRNPTLVERILALQTVELDAKDSSGDTALLLALERGDNGMVSSLLTAGSDVTSVGQNGNTALHCAVRSGNLSVVERILALQAVEFEAKNSVGNSSFLLALWGGHIRVAECLFPVSAALKIVKTNNDMTLVLSVMRNELASLTKQISLFSADLPFTNGFDKTLLMIAVRYGHKEIVAHLLEIGISAAFEDNKGNTVLHVAAYYKSYDVLKLLLTRDTVPVYSKNNFGWSWLNILMRTWDHAEIKVLFDQLRISQFSDVLLMPDEQEKDTPLHVAMQYQNSSLVSHLIDVLGKLHAEKALKTRNVKGVMPWHLAVQYQPKKVIEIVLDHRLPNDVVNTTSLIGCDLLTLSLLTIFGKLNMCKVEEKLPERSNLLMLMFAQGKKDEVLSKIKDLDSSKLEKLLCEPLTEYLTPLHLLANTAIFDESVLLSLLQKTSVRTLAVCLTPLNGGGDLFFHVLCRQQRSVYLFCNVLALLGKDVPEVIDRSNLGGRTPLHCAVSHGNYDLARLLLSLGANPLSKDNNGNTPHMVARCQKTFVEKCGLYGIGPTDIRIGGDLQTFNTLPTSTPQPHSPTASSSTASSSTPHM